tara:strand:+ start:2491 stop:4125 length:1635 start_codon:yes stop_codon:yes gene_type:complete
MCGIWAYIIKNKLDNNYDKIFSNFSNLIGRGPDSVSFQYFKNKYYLGFSRLSIIDLTPKGNQPFVYYYNDLRYTCICNGEIYNADDIKNSVLSGYKFNSSSDCEVLIPLYLKYKESMFEYLDGVFSFIIIVENNENDNIEYFIARDRIGVRPLYIGHDNNENVLFSSELKGIHQLCDRAEQFKPGYFMKINKKQTLYNQYYEIPMSTNYIYNIENDNLLALIRNTFINCVKKRLISDRPVCALLSGGLDSSLVCSIASKILKEKGLQLYTFSIGIPGSPDNKYAEIVAKHIGSKHTTINITEDQALESLNDVIWSVETYDITTIRASTGQYLVSKYIAENTDFKVVLSGDGSDEVTSGYLENFNAKSEIDVHNNVIDRIKNIHFFDVQRADRATSIHGLELRVPFLDVSFINIYLNIDIKLRQPILRQRCEKYLLRKAFKDNYLPDEILWRKKEAFSDGISTAENSWYKIIQNKCENLYNDGNYNELKKKYKNHEPISKESLYFRKKYEDLYTSNFDNIIPYFWMPKWSNTNDPSARTLQIYNN